MQLKGIKRGNNIELLKELNIPDGQEVIIEVQDCLLISPEERVKDIRKIIDNWDPEAKEDFIKTMEELEKEKNEQWEKLYGKFAD
jgi:antitoxin component of MazEF toxin-antitoxin module